MLYSWISYLSRKQTMQDPDCNIAISAFSKRRNQLRHLPAQYHSGCTEPHIIEFWVHIRLRIFCLGRFRGRHRMCGIVGWEDALHTENHRFSLACFDIDVPVRGLNLRSFWLRPHASRSSRPYVTKSPWCQSILSRIMNDDSV
jgi:hypothetical protein